MAEPTPTELMTAISDSRSMMVQGLQDLHGAMLLGFRRVEERFDRVEERLDRVETRLTSVEGDVRGIHHWMARADARFEALEARL